MIVIPARLASTRFPEKIFADINGDAMFIATAKRVSSLDKVLIATDSIKALEMAKENGFEAIMTSEHHKSGTDRINEAISTLGLADTEVIINVQADEPFIEKEVIQSVIRRVNKAVADNEDLMIASCYKIVGKQEALDPNLVKVITDIHQYAIYFSRSLIPYDRATCNEYFAHLGIYGFTKKSLREFCALSVPPLEEIEKLEQLRAIYHSKKIAMLEVHSESFGIDTPEDLSKALQYFKV